MSISFSCDSCGKPFTVDDKFAGKKGKCKQCGATMNIPGGATSRDADREMSHSRRAPSMATAPKADLYGFDDEPLPARSSSSASRVVEDDGPPVPRARKKKSGGFFGGTKKKSSSSSGGPAAFTIVLRVVLALCGGLGGLVAVALGLPGLRSVLVPGWASNSDIEAFVKRQVNLTNDLTGILRTVTDVPSASAATSRANSTIKQMEQNLRSNKDRKGNQKAIEAIKQKYLAAQQQSVQSFTAEVMRVASIPGAMEALAIQQSLMSLGAVEQQIPGMNTQANFTPPPMPSSTPIPPPNLNMPPGTGPGGMPGMQPPTQPTPHFGPGMRHRPGRRGFPQPG